VTKPARRELAAEQAPNKANGEQRSYEDVPDQSDTEASEDDSGAEDEIKEDEVDIDEVSTSAVVEQEPKPKSRKRKNRDNDETLEAAYWDRIAREEAKEEAKAQEDQATKRRKLSSDAGSESDGQKHEEKEDAEEMEDEPLGIPLHESLLKGDGAQELDKSKRTVFLGNVASEAISSKSAKKTLLKHLSSFLSDLPAHKPPHKIESIRFRSTAFSSTLPKKAAFVKKDLMEATTKCTHAYVVYSTQRAATAAVRCLNGTIVLNRHLCVDSVAHPRQSDPKRCVFVGNLGFVDDESSKETEGGEKTKKKTPSDSEEGLWRQFGKAGTVESVRVIRDSQTRVGKGFAYVQFLVSAF
jgi:nucleolar protein 12